MTIKEQVEKSVIEWNTAQEDGKYGDEIILRFILTEALHSYTKQREEAVREEEQKRIAFEITQIPRVSDIGAIPETNDYANGWNDCRKKARENVVKVLQVAHKIALSPQDKDV